MNAWLAASPCGPRCVLSAGPPVPTGEIARRYAATARVMAAALASGRRLVEPTILRSHARRLLNALGVGVYVDGRAPSLSDNRGTLVVANHISWLDTVVMTACQPMTQLAKRETASWPVIGSTGPSSRRPSTPRHRFFR